MKQYAYFSELPIKTEFVYNGNICKKETTRTATLTEYGRKFYFKKLDLVIVGKYNRLDQNYFKGN
jgi:hypothetical protein